MRHIRADLELEITNACNLRCKMCNIWTERPKSQLTAADILAAIAATKRAYGSVANVSITGGECFLNPELPRIVDTLLACQQQGIVSEFDLVTNGYFVDQLKTLLGDRKEALTAARWSIAFSIDGLEATHNDQRGNPDSFRRITESIAFVQAEFPQAAITIKYTATPLNYRDCLPLYAWCKERGLKFSPKPAEPTPLSTYYHRDKTPLRVGALTSEMTDAFVADLQHILNDPAPNATKHAIAEIIAFFRHRKLQSRCHTPLRSLFIDAFGNIYPCLYFKAITNLHEPGWEQHLFSPRHKEIAVHGQQLTCPGCLSYHGSLKPYNVKNSLMPATTS